MIRRTRRIALLLLAIAGLAFGQLSATASGAEQPTNDPSRPRVRLIAQSPFTNPIDVFTLRLRIDNAPDNAKLAFRLYEDVASRGRGIFQQTIVGRSLGGARRTITVAIDNLPRNDDGSYTASFPVGGTATPFTLQVRPGQVYPFAVSLQNVDGDELDRFITYLITLPIAANNEAPPLAVAVIVPISSRPGFQPDGRIEFSDSERDRIDSMLRALANTAQVPATIAPTPETIWALGELIGNTPQWRAMLIRTADRRQVLGGPYVNLEVGAFVDAGMNDELARQFRLGTDRLSTDFDTRPDRQTWIMDPSITPEALTRLKELGVDQVVIPEHLLTGIGPERTIAQPFEIEAGNGERIRAVMAEDRLAAHVFDTDMPALNAHHVLADLATLFHEQPSVARGAVVLANELGASAEFVETLLGALGQQPAPTTDADVGGKPIFTATTIDQLVERVGGSVVNGQPQVRGYLGQTPPSLGSFPTQLGYAYHSLAGYRSLLGPADAGRAESIERNLWVSSARQLDPQQRQNYLDAAVGLINHEAEQIRFPPQSSVTLTAEDAEIPVVVENGTGYPVTVKIRFTSDKLEFPGGAERIVRLEPGMNRLNVEVRARASGAFPVTVSMSSPDDAIAIGSTKFRLRSTAVSGIGLLLSIGAGLFLLIWWSRHFRSVRRRSQLVTPLDHQRHAAGANCETAGREGTTSK